MGRKKKVVVEATDAGSVMAAMVAAAEKQFGAGHMYIADQHAKRQIGLPLPSLALEYALYSNVLYLGSVYGIAGPPASYKSSLGLEFAKLICKANGNATLTETEGGKISSSIVQAILGEYSKRLLMKMVTSVEDAQAFMTSMIEWGQSTFPERNQLIGYFLDSLNGSGGKEKHEKMLEEGYASRNFPVEALLWTSWLQTFSSRFIGWPMVLVFVNHQKADINNTNAYRHPGGVAQEFYATVYMHVRRLRVNDGATQRVSQVELRIVKHSFEPEGRRIEIPFVMDKTQQPNRLYFDWGHATAHLLSDKTISGTIGDIINVTTTSNSMTALTRRFSCKQLGLKEVTGEQLGIAIQQDDKLMADLRKALGIQVNEIWSGCTLPVLSTPEAIPSTTTPAEEYFDGDADDDKE